MGRIDLKTTEGILRLECSIRSRQRKPYQWCEIYYITENEETYLAARVLDILLSKLLIAFIDVPDRRYVSYKGMQNAFTISSLECSHSALLGNKTESGELEIIFEGTQGELMKLATLSVEDQIDWVKSIFDQLTKNEMYIDRWAK